MFIDEVQFHIVSGKGGDGAVSFRREAKVDKGGPDGGDGGSGGDVVAVVNTNLSTLQHLRQTRILKAKNGGRGGTKNKTGKSGEDCVIELPAGTMIKSPEGELLADLVDEGEIAVLARGGRGGKGNARFASSTNRAPRHRELGEPGAELDICLELKLLADVGFIGLPSVGKSTLLSRISSARPKIADYPFTTLEPNLGVVDRGGHRSWVAADLPGLIEGASDGKGLGHRFLRHVERTRVMVHLLDVHSLDPAEDYRTITQEIAAYSASLSRRPCLLCLNKIDTVDHETAGEVASHIAEAVGQTPLTISAVSGAGLDVLLQKVDDLLEAVPVEELREERVRREYRYSPEFTVEPLEEGEYRITGEEVEKRAAMTDPSQEESLSRFWKMMERRGIAEALRRAGVEEGDTVHVGPHTWEYRD